MKAYSVVGEFLMGRGRQRFAKEVAAADEAGAREVVLSDLGSRHRVPRSHIKIIKVREVSHEEIDSSAVEFKVGRADRG
jgi:large subunit ribosomal protein LX